MTGSYLSWADFVERQPLYTSPDAVTRSTSGSLAKETGRYQLFLPLFSVAAGFVMGCLKLHGHTDRLITCISVNPQGDRMTGLNRAVSAEQLTQLSNIQTRDMLEAAGVIEGKRHAAWSVLWDSKKETILSNQALEIAHLITAPSFPSQLPSLLLTDPARRGEVMTLCHLIEGRLLPDLQNSIVSCPDNQPHPDLGDRASETLRRLNDRLAWQDFLVGNEPSLADLLLFAAAQPLHPRFAGFTGLGTLDRYDNILRLCDWIADHDRIRHLYTISSNLALASFTRQAEESDSGAVMKAKSTD